MSFISGRGSIGAWRFGAGSLRVSESDMEVIAEAIMSVTAL